MEGNTSQRVFVAINIPTATKKGILYWQHKINDKSLRLDWAPIHNIHLTLVFLGNITDWEIQKLIGLIDDIVSGFKPFRLNLRRFGVFKENKEPRVFYIKPHTCRRLNTLQLRIHEAVRRENIGRESDQKFTPHITIGRFRSGEINQKLLHRWLRQKVAIDFKVETVNIMASNTSVQPSRYNRLHGSYLEEA